MLYLIRISTCYGVKCLDICSPVRLSSRCGGWIMEITILLNYGNLANVKFIQTIQRIGFLSKKKKAKDVKKSDADIESRLTPDMIKQRKVALERITALGSHLFDSDQSAYEKSYEQIVRLLRSKDLIGIEVMDRMNRAECCF